jgi:hypothetical protein
MASTRNPSHLTSNCQPASSNGAATSVASIGGMNVGNAAFAGLRWLVIRAG